ncbi:hypothetical protein HHI36_022530 [Cryptolaemus montrouzieri]|uniref:Uncharacterized protein n=1 Tax=Cryptolaemus montrouzieri TaxID=559131 RepID=A0ABD2N035_9CUCU
MSSKSPTKVLEECSNKIIHELVVGSMLISSDKLCKIIIDDVIFENTFNNFSHKFPNIEITHYYPSKTVNLEQKHLEDFKNLQVEAKNLNTKIELHPLVHVTHISITVLLLITVSIGCSFFLWKKFSLYKFSKTDQEMGKYEEGVHLNDLYPRLPTAPAQDEDVLT